MNNQYIIFNGICSLDIPGLYIEQYLPSPDIAQRRVTKTPVAGRSGDLRILQSYNGQDIYESIEKSIGFSYKGDDLDTVKNWLRGDGNLILSNTPDRFWKASIDNTIPIAALLNTNMRNFTVVFSCYPYAFLNSGIIPIVYNPDATFAPWETIIMNDYDIALPHFLIAGSGDVGLLINNVEVDLFSLVDYIEMDSNLQQCYNGINNLGMNMAGDFPILNQGQNIIEFTGAITRVEITPNWRKL